MPDALCPRVMPALLLAARGRDPPARRFGWLCFERIGHDAPAAESLRFAPTPSAASQKVVPILASLLPKQGWEQLFSINQPTQSPLSTAGKEEQPYRSGIGTSALTPPSYPCSGLWTHRSTTAVGEPASIGRRPCVHPTSHRSRPGLPAPGCRGGDSRIARSARHR